jgi:hypothetical protein
VIQAFGLRSNFLLKQLPFLPNPLRRILRQHSQFGGNISKAMAQTGTQPIHGGAKHRFRRAHRSDTFN